MLADQVDYVVGVDPHRDSHALAIVHVLSGAVVFEATIAASSRGYAEALQLVDAHALGRRAFAVEGSGSFGAGLTRFLTDRGERVLEVEQAAAGASLRRQDRRARCRPCRPQRARPGAAGDAAGRRGTPGTAGTRGRARRRGQREVRGLGQLRDLLVTTPEPLRNELRPLTAARLLNSSQPLDPSATRSRARGTLLALRSIARRVLQLTAEERELAREIETITRKLAPQLLDQPGVGPHSAAQLVLSWSHPGRIRSEAAFARLAGAAPIPASSGQTIRYRLDRSGDRKLNRALHLILVTRKRTHPPTRAYIERRIQEGKTRREATAASSATSPATSTAYSNTDRHWRLDKHRSIAGPTHAPVA